MATDIADPEAQAVSWDLEPLVDGEGAAGVGRQLDEADRRAAAFAERYAGQVAGKGAGGGRGERAQAAFLGAGGAGAGRSPRRGAPPPGRRGVPPPPPED